MRMATSFILTGADYAVEEAEHGEAALEKLRDDLALIITDYNMPGMNGVELIGRIRGGKTASMVPILMLTTESEEDKKSAAKEAGATGWITKPFDQEKLLKTVKKLVG
jgi:two-component system chemotaxis response regulator CheY